MTVPKDAKDLTARLNEAKDVYKKRDELMALCSEMYRMTQERTSAFLGADKTSWRMGVPRAYWHSSNRAQNSIDIATAVLSGHPPQFKVTIPGGGDDALTSRAEKFLMGLWRSNSRRQWTDLYRRVCFRTVHDGQAAVRVVWDKSAPAGKEQREEREGKVWQVVTYPRNECPISIEVIPMSKIYPMGPPTYNTPFSEIFHSEERTASEVIQEWGKEEIEGADVSRLQKGTSEAKRHRKGIYTEWWGYDEDDVVNYMVTFDDATIIVGPKPEEDHYARIPYVVSAFKEADETDPTYHYLPLIFPIIWAVEREEFLRSRIYKLIDLYANLPPYHKGSRPRNISGTWGDIMNFDPDEDIVFPKWPGSPPDVWKTLENILQDESQGTFSSAMYGEASTRLSGYGLSQLVGSDTLRLDTPRANLELLYSTVGDLIFDLLRTFSYNFHIAVTSQVKGHILSAMLAGYETDSLVVETFIKPKQSSDEARLATIGAQLASLPNPPVSMRYILENYFGIAQPEDEIMRVRQEEVERDPMVRMIGLLQVLQDQESPFAPLVQAQIMQMVQNTMQKSASGGIPQGQGGQLGMGMPQAAAGNPPVPGVQGENITEEAHMGEPEAMIWGGPRELGGG